MCGKEMGIQSAHKIVSLQLFNGKPAANHYSSKKQTATLGKITKLANGIRKALGGDHTL